MPSYWIKTSAVIKKIFSKHIWDLPNTKKMIYLTFDDGPTPEITEWILSQLKEHGAKATFFCIGKNIELHPELFRMIIQNGHAIGNHTDHHLNGWKTTRKTYLEDVTYCEEQIQKHSPKSLLDKKAKLFRPPYGRIRPMQAKELRKKGYKIVMWDVLSADFDMTISPEQCYENVIKNTTSGSIIVFHDSIKAFQNLKPILPKIIKNLKEEGFVFDVIR